MLQTVKVNKKYFSKLDLSKVPSPCYVIDTNVLEDNLKIFNKLKTDTNVKILLALKAFSLKHLFLYGKKHWGEQSILALYIREFARLLMLSPVSSI